MLGSGPKVQINWPTTYIWMHLIGKASYLHIRVWDFSHGNWKLYWLHREVISYGNCIVIWFTESFILSETLQNVYVTYNMCVCECNIKYFGFYVSDRWFFCDSSPFSILWLFIFFRQVSHYSSHCICFFHWNGFLSFQSISSRTFFINKHTCTKMDFIAVISMGCYDPYLGCFSLL